MLCLNDCHQIVGLEIGCVGLCWPSPSMPYTQLPRHNHDQILCMPRTMNPCTNFKYWAFPHAHTGPVPSCSYHACPFVLVLCQSIHAIVCRTEPSCYTSYDTHNISQYNSTNVFQFYFSNCINVPNLGI